MSYKISLQRDDTPGTYRSSISDSHKLYFAGKLYTPDDSLLIIDVAGSQDSFSSLAKSEKEMVIDEQRGAMNTQEEKFEKLLKKLKSQIGSRQIDSVTRQNSLLSNPQTEEYIIPKTEPYIYK